eukprot:TRINITY_DN36045_c0_g1_i1.p1 TRINITY_DN36045_c0_g1~~TRINITY_DN36045_c0_g1_i1.p1  ORF type:complete len:663 (+),score=123.98 TRINITY_DN36045_c0_g1_i1:52-2040(+)
MFHPVSLSSASAHADWTGGSPRTGLRVERGERSLRLCEIPLHGPQAPATAMAVACSVLVVRHSRKQWKATLRACKVPVRRKGGVSFDPSSWLMGSQSIEDDGGLSVLTLTVKNDLPFPLLPEGMWVKSGSSVQGPLLEKGVPSQSEAGLCLEGSEVEALIWFRTPQWPLAVLTLAVVLDVDGTMKVAGEWARVLLPDARQLLQRASVVATAARENRSLQWKFVEDFRELSVTVLSLPSTALLPRRSLRLLEVLPEEFRPEAWPEWAPPSLGALTTWVINAVSGPRVQGLSEQLQEQLKKFPDSMQVVDRRFFDLLGLDPGAKPRAIRAAWRQKAQELHPDRTGGSRERFDEIKQAFQVLSDPAMRARYEALGTLGVETGRENSEEAPLDSFIIALGLLLGAWALRPLLGGPLRPPLGLGMQQSSESDAVQDVDSRLRAAVNSELRTILGALELPEAEAETLAELRAALVTSQRLSTVVESCDPEKFERDLRLEVRSLLRAASGTLAPHLLARWGAAQHAGATAWLEREAPSQIDGALQASSLGTERALQAFRIAGTGVVSLASLPAAMLTMVLSPEGVGRMAAESMVSLMVEVAYRTAALEIDQRGAAAARRVLDDETKPWQQRWRAAHTIIWFGNILSEEGVSEEPDLAKFVSSNNGSSTP